MMLWLSVFAMGNLLPKNVQVQLFACGTTHSLQTMKGTFSLPTFQTRVDALRDKTLELKREISMGYVRSNAGESWRTAIVKAVNAQMIGVIMLQDEVTKLDEDVIKMMISQAFRYPDRNLAVIPSNKMKSSEKFLSGYSVFDNYFMGALRTNSKFEATISAKTDTEAWQKTSNTVLNLINLSFDENTAEKITRRLLLRTCTNPAGFMEHYKLESSNLLTLFFIIHAGQLQYLHQAEGIKMNKLFTLKAPSDKEIQYWTRMHNAKQLVKRTVPTNHPITTVKQRNKRNLISDFLGGALGLETVERGEKNKDDIQDLTDASEKQFRSMAKNINSLKSTSMNNSLAIDADEQIIADMGKTLSKIAFILPEIQILNVVAKKTERAIQGVKMETEKCLKDLNCKIAVNGSAVILVRPKVEEFGAEVAIIQSLPFHHENKVVKFGLPGKIFFNKKGEILPAKSCHYNEGNHKCECSVNDEHIRPEECEKKLLEYIRKRTPLQDKDCAENLRLDRAQQEDLIRVSKNAILYYSTASTDCTTSCKSSTTSSRVRGLTHIIIPQQCEVCCGKKCAWWQGLDTTEKMNMPHIVADAFRELNKIKIANISFQSLMTELKKEEYKNMSVKNVADEIRRKSRLSFRQTIEELQNSHRLSPLIIISTATMITMATCICLYCCRRPIKEAYKLAKCCANCLPSSAPRTRTDEEAVEMNRQAGHNQTVSSVFTEGSARDNSRANLLRTRPHLLDASTDTAYAATGQISPQVTGSSIVSNVGYRPPPYNLQDPIASGN